MMTTSMILTVERTDSDLIRECLSGNSEAFGQIVSKYQSLVCSLAYSATGSLSQSEDLAQDTFVTAWKQLANLREPEKLRPWLCGIARNLINNWLRKQGREPSRHAEPLEEVPESLSPEPIPTEQAISKEEEAILWRSLGRIPEIYREPLVMFYREHQSIEIVAVNLNLTEEAVKQRLSRGRKLLQEQVLSFVEGTLERTNPGKAFTLAVLASLPALTFSAKAAAVGTTIAKGGVTAKTAGAAGLYGMLLGPLIVFLPNYLGFRLAVMAAKSDEERKYIKAFYRKVTLAILAISIPFAAAVLWLTRNQGDHSWLGGVFATGMTVILLSVMVLLIPSRRSQLDRCTKLLNEEYGGVFPKPTFEYRSAWSLLGLPLIHICIGDRFAILKKPIKAWIAIGNYAIGGLFASGPVAVAPLSIGGLAAGGLSFGGLSAGIFALGGIAVGAWPLFGGILIGWQAFGGCIAIAWSAAIGDFAIAHGYALGRFAYAMQTNNDVARQFIGSNLMAHAAEFINRHWLWINLIWIVPFFIQWQVLRRAKA